MIEQPKYFDVRSEFWQKVFDQSVGYEQYLTDSPPEKADRWREMAEKIPALTAEQADRLSGHHRRVNVLCMSGVWCGDCVRQGPMLERIAQATGGDADLRWIDRDANVDVRDELRICGAMRVPAVVFLTEDFWEIGRFGDRLLTVYRRKAQNELGAACAVPYAVPPEGELTAEQNEWVDVFERMLLMARLSPPLRQRHSD